MLSLYEILKASKTGIAPDMWTALAGKNWGGDDSGHEIKELTGIPPLSFRADGTPLLDYLISGNMSQTGTPTPTNPIQPQECGERTGNLLDWSGNLNVVNGTVKTNQDVISSMIDVHNINTLYFTGDISLMNSGIYRLAKSNSTIDSGSTVDSYSNNFTGGVYDVSNCNFLLVTASVYGRPAGNKQLIKSSYMCNVGSTALPFEPYGIKIPISSANTTTPVYLGEVESTRRVKKLVLTGEENWYINEAISTEDTAYLYTTGITSGTYVVEYGICSHFEYINVYNIRDVNGFHLLSGYGGLRFRIMRTIASTVSDFKAYLAAQYANGTPVTIWYVLAEPTTGIVNEPLRKIGDYADTLSMEQAGVQIPTNRGNTVIDVETTLKPSEMYIKYQG